MSRDACVALRLSLAIHREVCKDKQCERDIMTDFAAWLEPRVDVDEPELGVRVPNEAAYLLKQTQERLTGLEPAPAGLLTHSYVRLNGLCAICYEPAAAHGEKAKGQP